MWITKRKSIFKWLSYGVFAVVLLVLQSARTPGLMLWGAGANLLPFLVAATAQYEGCYVAGTMGFFSGLLLAVNSSSAEGLACLYLSVTGVLLGWVFETYFRKSILLPIGAGVLCIVISELCKTIFYYMLFHSMSFHYGLLSMLGTLILSLPGGIIVCFICRWMRGVFAEAE